MPASVNSAVTASTHAIVTNGNHHEQELSRARVQSSEPPSPRVSTYYDDMYRSAADSNGRYVSQQKLAPLQASNTSIHDGRFDPVVEDDPSSFDLVAGKDEEEKEYTEDSLEKTSQALFSKEHLQVIFADPTLLLGFTTFLGTHRPQSVPILVHYLDALKSLRAIHYANAICEGLDPVEGLDFTKHNVRPTSNPMLEARAATAFDILAKEELPAFVCHQYIQIVSASITARITGSLAPDLRDASEGLAEVFTLTDPSRSDNPIVFASEEFNRTTQYGMNYIIGRNCRFLQGPMTNPTSVRRLRDAVQAGKQHHEVFLNYRRDGSPFVNLLMIAPLCDSRGVVRYHVGAQVDVSGLVKDSSDMESLQRLLDMQARGEQPPNHQKPSPEKSDELRELSEMLNQNELSTIKTFGGRMHRESREDDEESVGPQQPRLLIKDPDIMTPPLEAASGRLSGIYQHVSLPIYSYSMLTYLSSFLSDRTRPSVSSSQVRRNEFLAFYNHRS